MTLSAFLKQLSEQLLTFESIITYFFIKMELKLPTAWDKNIN